MKTIRINHIIWSLSSIASFLWLAGCSSTKTLNLHVHEFAQRPSKIVWLQIAGFSTEHLLLLNSLREGEAKQNVFEASSCIGNLWSFNSVELRPRSDAQFLSQITGSSTLKNSCEDFKKKPAWYFLEQGFEVGAFVSSEGGSNPFSEMLQCVEEVAPEWKNSTYWLMSKADEKISMEKGFFNSVDKNKFDSEKVYYDLSCQKEICFSNYFTNVQSIYERFKKSGPSKQFLLIQDFSYEKALKSRKILRAAEILSEIEKSLALMLSDLSESKQPYLVLVTTASSLPVEFPVEGSSWERFKLKGESILYKRENIISPVFAFGAGAENFCGIYSQSDILNRLIYRYPNKNLKILNLGN